MELKRPQVGRYLDIINIMYTAGQIGFSIFGILHLIIVFDEEDVVVSDEDVVLPD